MQQQQQQQHSMSETKAVNVPAPPVGYAPYYVIAAPSPTLIYPNFPGKQVLGVGITSIVAGSLSIIFNIVGLVVYINSGAFIGHGIWTGVLCIVAGGIGLGARAKKTKCMICAFNVLSIIAAAFTSAQFAVGIVGAILSSMGLHCDSNNYYYYYYYSSCSVYRTSFSMAVLMTVLAVVEAVAAIWGSAICCKTYCCCTSCEVYSSPVMTQQPAGVPMQMIAGGVQPMPVMVVAQGYNTAFQPGFSGQLAQSNVLLSPPAYPIQGQLLSNASDQILTVPQYGQPLNPPLAVQSDSGEKNKEATTFDSPGCRY